MHLVLKPHNNTGFDHRVFSNIILGDMKKNMGGIDKLVRVILAAIAVLLVYFEIVDDTIAIILLAIAAIFVLTSLVGFCPLYGVLGWDSCTKKR